MDDARMNSSQPMPASCPSDVAVTGRSDAGPSRGGNSPATLAAPDYLALAAAQARLLAEQVRPRHEAHVDAWLYTELPEDELALLEAELDAIWSSEGEREYRRTSAESAGHQVICERLCNRIAVLKGQR